MALWKQWQYLITAALNKYSHDRWAPWTPHLQLPDASALHGDILHSAVHEGDEHVQQQDVGEYDVADEEHVKDLLVLVVLSELHVAHADGELEKLQGGVGDVSKGGFDTLFSRVSRTKERYTSLLIYSDVSHRGFYEQGDHRCDRGYEESVDRQHIHHLQLV